MSRLHPICIILFLLASSLLPAWGANTAPAPGSYLTRSVSDARDFARLLREDRVVAQRFANHYGINNDAIADYVEQNARVVTLSKRTTVTEFFIDKRGRTQRRQKVLRPGHGVLVVDGTPILDMKCGNPIGKALPSVPPPPRPVVQRPPAPPVETLPPPVEITEVPTPPPPLPPAVTPPPPPPEVAVVPPAPPPPPPAPAPVTRRGRPFPWFLLAGGLLAFDGDDDDEEPPPPPTPVIPEASSLALGAGGMGFVLTYLRMRRGRGKVDG